MQSSWSPRPQAPGNGPLFRLLRRADGSEARLGILDTRHGPVPTPVFMPVGTLGAIKGLEAADLEALGAGISLANAYHLMLRPGPETVAELGGLHAFAGQRGALLTDSGGYQVFSLAAGTEVDEDGVTFRSHLDGARVRLTPERLTAVQEALGPDIAMVLDQCPPGLADVAAVQVACARSSRWARRCLDARRRADVRWFAIVQGGTHAELRRSHAEEIGQLPCDGFAIGGISVGESTADIRRVVALTAPLLPDQRPRYLMGGGTPHDLVHGVAAGIDMFDCVMPSRHARNGQIFVAGGRINLRNRAHQRDPRPLCESCSCSTCQRHSRAFLRHLMMAGELSYHRLATMHNLSFYLALMRRLRAAIAANAFDPAAELQALGPERANLAATSS